MPAQTVRGEHDVHQDDLPRELRAPLEPADAHLDQEERKHAEAEAKEARRTLAVCGEIPDREQEREQEDADDRAVHVDGRLQRSEAVDVLAAARVRPAAVGIAADDESEPGADEDGEPPQLGRHER